MAETQRSDVIVLGAGLVGMTLALALEAGGLSVAMIDPADPAAQLAAGFDGRASAVSSSSWRMLEALGLGSSLGWQGDPIERIRVAEGTSGGALSFVPDLEGDGPLGLMFENRLLRTVLREACEARSGIRLLMPARAADVARDAAGVHVTLADGRSLTAPLLVAAEGRNSPMREAAGIKVARWRYDHSAIVTMLDHDKPHGNVAHEIFYPAGPFALLPLKGGHRSALVWSMKAEDAPAMVTLNARAFAAEAEKRSGGIVGTLTLTAPRSTYPLGFHHAAQIIAERLALIGDAAHGIHPIAGQGLNLGFRDAAALAEVLIEGARSGLDLGDPQLLARYQRWRSLDTLMVAGATDGLTRLFGVSGRAATAVRRFGLGVVERVSPLKAFFMAEARGESGALPRLLKGLPV
ncbi:MAG: UbiH/UbiF/VisC/COQ6 family ubiquinone biosynthesis hydroxylase [Sphingomonadaceae bacterium]|nr:UbiH/UbiF/VisC/COQ6 family ubiquinone biosynthesis hydroxylase [Sphingomonadaceae bacterium]